MKFLFAIVHYYPYGGLEKSFLNICREALARGHQLDIVCTGWEGERLPGATLGIFPAKASSNHGILREFAANLQQHMIANPADTVVGFKRLPGLDLYYAGDVCFRNQAHLKHGGWYRLTPRYRVMSEFEAAVFSPQSGTGILYISESEKANYQRCYQTPDERFFRLPPGIDRQSILAARTPETRRGTRAELGVADHELLCLMVGSDFRRKGVDRAIEAISSLPAGMRRKTRLAVAGQGKPLRYQKLAEKNGLENPVQFLGGRSDVPALLSACDLVLHPARVETAGNVILEGLVAGKPVIVSENAGFSAHVRDSEGGRLVGDGDGYQPDFNRHLRELVSNETLRLQLAENALRYADSTDLYRRPQVAMDFIEATARKRSREAER